MGVYDCIMFYNELDMLETRLNILDEVIDHFVICEAGQTHSGQLKPYNLLRDAARFDAWHDRITYVQVDDLTGPGRNSWERERFHRLRIQDGLWGIRPTDWVLVSDCDEIPDPDKVSLLSELPLHVSQAKFELDFYYYDFNHRVKEGWSIGAVRSSMVHDPNDIRTNSTSLTGDVKVFLNAGWHLSYFMSPDGVVDKLNAFMHHDDVAKYVPRDPQWIAEKMAEGKDLFGRTTEIVHLDVPVHLPQYVVDHQDKFKKMGWLECTSAL